MITAYRDHGKPFDWYGYGRMHGRIIWQTHRCSKGKGGSMHFLLHQTKTFGAMWYCWRTNTLVWHCIRLKTQEEKETCMCFMGDGATNQGPFYESLNLASLWGLPVVYIIENNGYSMGTAESRHSAGEPPRSRGEAFDINWSVHQKYDLYEVRDAINNALVLAKESSSPSVLEIVTYRYRNTPLPTLIKHIGAKRKLKNTNKIKIR